MAQNTWKKLGLVLRPLVRIGSGCTFCHGLEWNAIFGPNPNPSHTLLRGSQGVHGILGNLNAFYEIQIFQQIFAKYTTGLA